MYQVTDGTIQPLKSFALSGQTISDSSSCDALTTQLSNPIQTFWTATSSSLLLL